MSPDQDNYDDLNDWIDALENLILFDGEQKASEVIDDFIAHLRNKNLLDSTKFEIPFENSISQNEELDYPGNWDIEEKIRHNCFKS